MKDPSNRVRLSVDIREDQKQDLDRLLPWGVGRSVFEVIVDDLIDMLKKHGSRALVPILDKRLRPSECMPSLNMKEGS